MNFQILISERQRIRKISSEYCVKIYKERHRRSRGQPMPFYALRAEAHAQSIALSMEKRVIFLEVFFWNSTSRNFTRLTAL